MKSLWEINQVFTNPVYIASLCTFFACFLISIIIMILMNIYRRIIQTTAKTIDLVKDLIKSPLKFQLLRVSLIYEASNTFEKNLIFWRTKYEILFEKELQKLFIELFNFLNEKKNSRPNLNNLRKIFVLYEKATNINKNAHNVYIEILNELEIEYIQRDSITNQKEIFRIIKEEIFMATFSEMNIEQRKLDNTIAQIEDLFEDFYLKIDDGNYKESWEILVKIDQALIFLIELLDTIPFVYSTINITIPKLMIDLKNNYVTFGQINKKLPINAIKYQELEKEIDHWRIKIKNDLKNLQFKKANKKLNYAFSLINEFKLILENEDNLKTFFEHKGPDIRSKFEMIDQSIRVIERNFLNIENMSKNFSKDRNEFEISKSSFLKTKAKADLLFSQIDLGTNSGNDIKLEDIKDQLLELMQQVLKEISGFEKSAKIVEAKSTNINSLVNQVIFIESILNQLEVKINQYKSIIELKKFVGSIQEMYANLQNFSISNLNKISTIEDKEMALMAIENYNQEVLNLARDFNDTIFLDYISQEIIVYLERYVGKVLGIEDVILTCERLFKERNLHQLIGFSINKLLLIKENVK